MFLRFAKINRADRQGVRYAATSIPRNDFDIRRLASRNHAALNQFVHDLIGDDADKFMPHLWIGAQHLHSLQFPCGRRRLLGFLLHQLLASG